MTAGATAPLKRSYRSPAVDRAFEVLEVLAETRDGLSLADLGRSTGIPASSLLAILGSLQACRAVRATPAKRYLLDIGILELGHAFADGDHFVGLFDSIGERLLEEFNETVQLGALSGGDVVYVGRQESTQPVRLVARVGRRLPAHASGVGKVLLAWLDEDELYAALGEEPFAAKTSRTITTYTALGRELATIRRLGFSQSREECIPGLHCIAAPVFDHTGRPVAGICVSVPTTRMTRALQVSLAAAVIAGAGEMSEAMASGYGRLRLVDQTFDAPDRQPVRSRPTVPAGLA